MTHRLLLLRHAKSSWDDPALPDRDRPLAERGRRAAEQMGAHLRASGLLPDLVLCSSARRTRETLDRLDLSTPDVRVDDGLYGADDDELLARARELSEGAGTVLVIGHNPGMHDLAIRLTGGQPGDEARRLHEKFPTAALAVFDVDGAWARLDDGAARLSALVVPRDLA
jgi:phosphohistidine phosphatase